MRGFTLLQRACNRLAVLLLATALLDVSLFAQLQTPPALRPWSRAQSQTADGFYFQPEVIGEDFPHATRAQVLRDIALTREVGAKALRFGVSWLETEPEPGQYRWAKLDVIIHTAHEQGMPLIPYLCYTPRWAVANPKDADFWSLPPRDPEWFARFARAVATRYKGKVLAWGLWNEPDNVYWKGTPQELGKMIWAAARAIKEVDPQAGIWMGGLAEGADRFFRDVITTEHVERTVNAIGMHGYPETWDARTPEQYYYRELSEMRELLNSVHSADDLWADENGYSDYRYSNLSASKYVDVPIIYDYEHTRAHQAVELWRDHIEVLSSGTASLMGWYRIHDLPASTEVVGDANNRFLGLVDVTGRRKPDFYALRFYDALFDQPTRSLDEKVTIRPERSQAPVDLHVIEKKNGDVVVTGWLKRPDPATVRGRNGRARDRRPAERVEVQFPPGYQFSRIRRYRLTGQVISDQKIQNAESPFVLHGFAVTGADANIVVLSR